MATPPRNDRSKPVTKFCLAMEEHRRTPPGRVRTAREMLDHFFPRGAEGAVDRVFVHIPAEVRGPVIAGWGIRGEKAALRDTDEKVRSVVDDALASGDVDEKAFEEGLTAPIVVDWIPVAEWWAFWRSGSLTGVATQKALATGRELGLFDDEWLLENVHGRGGRLKGTDTICDTLSKEQIVSWLRSVHESGDGSPAGLVAALGWEAILTKTSQEALLFALDAFAGRVGLVTGAPATAADKTSVSPSESPAEADPPSMDSFFNAPSPGRPSAHPSAGTSTAVAEARAAMLSTLAEEQAEVETRRPG